MIRSLHIENYALIDSLDISFEEGFSVITGETGAGKSIMLGAINLLLGQRADSKSIKNGANRCVIEASFDVAQYAMDKFFEANDLDFDGSECIIRRELTSAGKSRAFINDTPVALAVLKEIGEQLIDIHSQHQNLLINKEDFQINVLDIIANDASALEKYQQTYTKYRSVCKQLQDALDASQRNRDDEDYIRFQYTQLEDANLQEGEQQQLEEESEILSHAEDIKQGLYGSLGNISNDSNDTDTLQSIRQSISYLQDIASVFPGAESIIERLESCHIELKDIAEELESEADSIEFNPRRLEEVNDRLNTIYSLQQKHHVDTVEELIGIQEELDRKLSLIDNSDELLEDLRKAKDAVYAQLISQGQALTKARCKAAKTMEKQMVERLLPLGMPNVRFAVDIVEKSSPDILGMDKVAFLFSANKNGTLQNVAQVASGGEIARVMLSLKAIIASSTNLPTIIFDEIDTGVSGSIAEKMARIMKEMSDGGRQVISITHLPQIAALGKEHYKVYKEDGKDSTSSHIIQLSSEQRVEEIAHMLSGETLTDAAISNAKALLGMG